MNSSQNLRNARDIYIKNEYKLLIEKKITKIVTITYN